MARPSKYDWESIEADYRAGLPKEEIRSKYKLQRNTLDNKIREKDWEVSSRAKSVIEGFEAVSGHLGALEAETPEILPAVYDRIEAETDFDIRSGRIVTKTLRKLEGIVDKGTKLEKVGVGAGIQSFEEVGMGAGDYKDVMDTVYRGKEVIKGKEAAQSVNVAVNNTQAVQVNNGEAVTDAIKRKFNT